MTLTVHVQINKEREMAIGLAAPYKLYQVGLRPFKKPPI